MKHVGAWSSLSKRQMFYKVPKYHYRHMASFVTAFSMSISYPSAHAAQLRDIFPKSLNRKPICVQQENTILSSVLWLMVHTFMRTGEPLLCCEDMLRDRRAWIAAFHFHREPRVFALKQPVILAPISAYLGLGVNQSLLACFPSTIFST